jgi:hypothetical protein
MNRTEQMLALVNDYRGSGMTQKEFCKEAGVGMAKLNYWISKSRETPSASGFVPLVPARRKEVTLEYPSGVKIAVDPSDLTLLSRLVRL